MDALAAFLHGPRARGAFVLRARLEPPWCLRIQDEAPLAVMAMASGSAWVCPDGAAPQRLRSGDLAITRGPAPYILADEVGRPPDVVVHPGERCVTADGRDARLAMHLGVRTWGNSAQGTTTMLVGTYERSGEVGAALLEALPPLLVLTRETFESPLVGLLAEEIGRDDLGQEAVLDRLLDLLLVAALRAWFATAGSEAPGWYRAYHDPVVGRAVRMLQHHPDRPWTVAGLASDVGVSRAALARRFTELVGEPPMAFLTRWRLALAADLLLEPDVTVGAVAREVGYATPFAFSAAFKRVRGVSPLEHRRLAASSPRADERSVVSTTA